LSLNQNERYGMRDPQFVDDLKSRLHQAVTAEVLPPLPKKFLKKRLSNNFKTGVYQSLLFHGAILLMIPIVSIVQKMTGMDAEREHRLKALEMAKTAIRVDMVALPTLKISEMQNVDLTKEVAEPMSAPEPEVIPEPESSSPTAMLDRSKEIEDQKKASELKKREQEQAKQRELDAKKRREADAKLKELQARLSADAKRRDAIEKLKGKANEGRAALGGNVKSEGYSLTGDVANQADVYLGRARAHVQKNWNVPAWMQVSTLSASIVVRIAADGRVLAKQFLRRSGNEEFDRYVERAIELSDPLPAPPEALRSIYMEDGIEWRFPN